MALKEIIKFTVYDPIPPDGRPHVHLYCRAWVSMDNDDRKAFDIFSKNREIQKPLIEELNGNQGY